MHIVLGQTAGVRLIIVKLKRRAHKYGFYAGDFHVWVFFMELSRYYLLFFAQLTAA